MYKWIKKIAVLLSLLLLLSTYYMHVYGKDYEEDEQKNISTRSSETFSFGINAINTAVKDGRSILLTSSYGDTIVAKNVNYNWCKVAVFDWNEKEDAYVLISLDRTLGDGMNKKAVIPPNGFAIVACPSFNPNYSNSISNYVFEHIDDLSVGTKVYLEGVDLNAGTFLYEGNIEEYYSTDFVTKAFVKVCQEKPTDCYEPDKDKLLDTPVFLNMNKMYTANEIQIEWSMVEGANEYYAAIFKSTMNTTGECVISGKITENAICLKRDALRAGNRYTAFVYAMGDNGFTSPVAQCTFMICSERAINSPFKDMKIVAFGDSITDYKGWVDMLYGELGCQVVNAGVAGDRTSQALARIERDVISEDPDLTIINFGMNDQAFNLSTQKNLTPIDQYEANYRKIIEKILATGSDIILVAVHDVYSPQYGGGSPVYNKVDENGVTYVDRYNEVVKRLADEYDVGFLDMNNLTEDILQFITVDGIHLNEGGQVKYFKCISDYCYEYAAPNSMEGNHDGGVSTSTIITVGVSITIAIISVVVFIIVLVKKNNHK